MGTVRDMVDHLQGRPSSGKWWTIFTGTVRDMVVDGRRAGQTAIVEIKRVVKGDRVLDRFTNSPDQLDHRASRHRRRRRMVAVTGLGERRRRTGSRYVLLSV